MTTRQKILAINFKYLGDVVISVPALRAIKEHSPESELHVLVPDEAVPLLKNFEWITRVWGYPRVRGKMSLKRALPVIRSLRREKFDASIDFVGNDRGALVSFLCGARKRFAPHASDGFMGRKLLYTKTVPEAHHNQHEVYRVVHIVSQCGFGEPRSLELELKTDPAYDTFATETVGTGTVIAHVTTSQPKKEWPLLRWAALHQMLTKGGHTVIFAAGPGGRDQSILQELKKLVPSATMLPVIPDLSAYLAVLKRASIFISGDTGPLHFAVALGVPTVSLFGPSNYVQWKPLGEPHQALRGPTCKCPGVYHECAHENYCVGAITPEQVMQAIEAILKRNEVGGSGRARCP